MLNGQSVIELMKQRYSCRSYQDRPISRDKQQKLNVMLDENSVGPMGTRSRYKLIAANDEDRRMLKGLTTYGFIRKPAGFILGAITNEPFSHEDFGYLMEKAVLFTTSLGLGSVWLGGTFNKSKFAHKMKLHENEILPAVVAIGYIAEQPRLIDAVIRRQANAYHRKPWHELFFTGSFEKPIDKEQCGEYATVLEMVRSGPSASNKQPWRIVRQENAWHFYMQRTSLYKPGTTRLVGIADMQRIDMGIAMCHFELTAKELLLSGMWAVEEPAVPEPDSLTEYVVTWLSQT